MKKIVSLLLSVVMLISALSVSVNAYAAGWLSRCKVVSLNTTYHDYSSASDYTDGDYFYDAYKFSIPIRGKISIHMESENKEYFTGSVYSNKYYIYSSSNLNTPLYYTGGYEFKGYSSATGMWYNDLEISGEAGEYYFVATFTDYCGFNNYSEPYYFTVNYSPSITKPSSFKVSSRKTTSIGLTWGRVGDVDGYQLYRNTKSGWKWVTNTTSNSYTVYDLKPGVKYDFRVRSYVEADGKKYYSGWKNLATPTKPATVTIKTPSTNKKHQIIAKWKKVADGTGYNVQYSKSKHFSSVIASKHISGISKTSYTGKNFTKGKTYYVRVRAYKTVNGTKYYGSWSKVKSIKSK